MTKNLLHVLHGRRDVEGALEIIEVRQAALLACLVLSAYAGPFLFIWGGCLLIVNVHVPHNTYWY